MRKSRLILAFVGSLFFTSSIAQIELDVKLGLNNSSVDVEGINEGIIPSTSSKTTFTIGTDVAYKLDKHFSLGTGFHYNRMGFNVQEGTAFNLAGIDIPIGVQLQVRENTISVPLYLQFTQPTKWVDVYLKAGASMHSGLGGTYKTVAKTIINITLDESEIGYSDSSLFNKNAFNMDLSLGLAVPYGHGKIITEFGISRGLTDKLESDLLDTDVRYNAKQFKVGYRMDF